MAKKKKDKKDKSKKPYRIKVTGKSYPKLDFKKIAKALGAEHITAKEKDKFRKRYGGVNWLGNFGESTPDAGTKDKVKCGICGSNMFVKRNVFGARSIAEAFSGTKHRYDLFTCSNRNETWHRRIYELRMDVYEAEMNNLSDSELDKKKRIVEKEIRKLIKANMK